MTYVQVRVVSPDAAAIPSSNFRLQSLATMSQAVVSLALIGGTVDEPEIDQKEN